MSGGYCYGEPAPTEKCPYCGTECHADFVDIGVGMQQCEPFHCSCGATEIGTFDTNEATADEMKKSWYAPDSPPGSSANVIAGKVVSYREARAVYEALYPFSATEAGQKLIRGKVPE